MIVLKSSYLLKHEMLDQRRKVFFLMFSVLNHFLHSITSHHSCPRTSRLVAVFTYRTAANRFYRVTKNNNKKRQLHRCWKRRVGVGLESVMPVPICNWGFVRFCWGTATCYDGYLWGAKHKSFPSERGGRLVKNETPGKQWWEKKKEKNEAEREKHSLRILSEKYQYRNPEQNTMRLYFLIEKGVVWEDPSKQLNMRKLIGWGDAFRGNHINHITAGTGNRRRWLTLRWMALKKKGTPHNYSQWSYMARRDFLL